MKKYILLVLSAFAMSVAPALAHTGVADANGFIAGLTHPVFGFDHLFVMLAVGIWSGFVLPERFWAGAAAFLLAMIAGAALAFSGVAIFNAETMIMASVVILGAMVAFSRYGQRAYITGFSLAVVAIFAVSHGYAHVTEATGHIGAYIAGFLLATAALHALGIAMAWSFARIPFFQYLIGGGIAASGMMMVLG